MKYYFKLQFLRHKRWFLEKGINPIFAIFLFILLFVVLSKYLFYKTEFAPWIYILFAISNLLNLSEQNRNNRLNILFNKNLYFKIRLFENIILSIPFLIYLVYEQYYSFVFGLSLVSLLMILFDSIPRTTRVIPTPFARFPFEYIIGFRKSILFFILAYFLVFKAIQVHNFNLAIVTLGFLFLSFMSFYLKPEQTFFVWIYAESSKRFILRKILASMINASIFLTPILIAITVFFPDKLLILTIVSLIGYIFLVAIILAKYSAYPNEINLPQAILFALSLWFPPMLLFVLPIFYKKSKQNLDSILA